jgi:hypothetical protein
LILLIVAPLATERNNSVESPWTKLNATENAVALSPGAAVLDFTSGYSAASARQPENFGSPEAANPYPATGYVKAR